MFTDVEHFFLYVLSVCDNGPRGQWSTHSKPCAEVVSRGPRASPPGSEVLRRNPVALRTHSNLSNVNKE